MDFDAIIRIMESNEDVSLLDFLPSSYPRSDDDFEPLSDEITQNDIFLLYAAFRRCMHHFSNVIGIPKSYDTFSPVFKDLYKWMKDFIENELSLFFNEQKYLAKEEVDEQYILEDTELVQFYRHADKIPNLSSVEDAHIHATDRHDPKYVWLSLFEKTDCFNHCRGVTHYSFKNYMRWMPSFMKEAILTIPESDRVKWCVFLLLTFHYEDECGAFVSCALKFCLRAFDLCEQAYRVYSFETFVKLMHYILHLIKEFECDTQVLLNCLRVHCVSHHIEDHFFEKPLLFKFMLGKIQASKANLPRGLVRIRSYFDPCIRFRKKADYFFVKNLDTFLTLLEFGTDSGYVESTYKELKIKIPYGYRMDKRESLRQLNLKDSKICKYRCAQLFYLYHCTPDLPESEKDQALLFLWSSIPELLLTKKNMVYSFQITSSTMDRRDRENMRQVWKWYDKIVAKGESQYRSPRRLQHLARCAIRQCLSAYFRLPIAIDSLMLPQKLQDYLLLKT